MIEQVPVYVPIVFILTTSVTVGFLTQAAKAAGMRSKASKVFLFALSLWLVFTAILAVGGFYQTVDSVPPRIFLFGVLPSILFIALYFVLFRDFIERIPLRLLTLLHVVRVPVELVLYWLFLAGQVPEVMTFAGWNFDILSGVLAIVVYFAAFRGGAVRKGFLWAFNLVGLALLVNIVSIAVMSIPSPMQQLAFDQPNRAVIYFPYVWLPAIIVPAVLFAHLASLWKLATHRE